MDNAYLQDNLYKYMSLICGEENSKTVFAVDAGDNKFVIGYEKDGVRQVSRVTRQIAICLVMGLNNYKAMHHEEVKPKRIRTL